MRANWSAEYLPIFAIFSDKPQRIGKNVPAYDFDTYPADFVIDDPDGKCFTLASEFRGIDDCCFVEIARHDRDMPESNDGHDIRNGQHAKVWDGNGRLIGMNTVFVEKTGLFKAPGGSQITLERVEITGVYVGYVSSHRLQPGGTYIRDHGDKVDDTTCSKGQDHGQDSTGGGFGPGTMIATQDGEIPVEWLQSGDMVLTRDHGYQPIVWIARARLPAEFFVDNPTWCPVSLPPACLGYDLPTHRLELMAGHGVVTGNATIKQCGFAGEVLSPASAWRDAGWAEPIAPEKEYTITHLFAPIIKSYWRRGLGLKHYMPGAMRCRVCHQKIQRI